MDALDHSSLHGSRLAEPEAEGQLLAFVGGHFRRVGLSHENRVRAEPLSGDGSGRRFWRVVHSSTGTPLIVAFNPPVDEVANKENLAYLAIGRHLRDKGLPIPLIHHVDLAQGWFLLEDLGNVSLQAHAASAHDPIDLYKRVLETLFRMQTRGGEGFDPSWCCQTQTYDRTVMRRFEADYFKAAFLHGYLGLKEDWPELEPSFVRLTEVAVGAKPTFFLHRDFQSRNIMISGDRIGIVDWQAGRLGPLAYDVASLLIDPYTDLSPTTKDLLLDFYVQILKEHDPVLAGGFHRHYLHLAIQRNLQILGAFGFLTKVRGKPYFEAYIPAAVRSLNHLLDGLDERALLPLKRLSRDLLAATTPSTP
jgi:aminoglycoside/choline kinase family phosphotransferase